MPHLPKPSSSHFGNFHFPKIMTRKIKTTFSIRNDSYRCIDAAFSASFFFMPIKSLPFSCKEATLSSLMFSSVFWFPSRSSLLHHIQIVAAIQAGRMSMRFECIFKAFRFVRNFNVHLKLLWWYYVATSNHFTYRFAQTTVTCAKWLFNGPPLIYSDWKCQCKCSAFISTSSASCHTHLAGVILYSTSTIPFSSLILNTFTSICLYSKVNSKSYFKKGATWRQKKSINFDRIWW